MCFELGTSRTATKCVMLHILLILSTSRMQHVNKQIQTNELHIFTKFVFEHLWTMIYINGEFCDKGERVYCTINLWKRPKYTR